MSARFIIAVVLWALSGATAAQAQTVRYIHTDALGTPVAVTNASRTVIEVSEYEPYGQVINRPLKAGPGYIGHVMDVSTGLAYMQQRYYDPSLGRFLSVDPVTADSNTGGNFNRYRYANNNPYRFTDPDGRQACDACKEFVSEVQSAAVNFAAEKTVAFVSALVDEGRAAVGQGIQDAKNFVGARDVVVTAGATGMAGAPIAGRSIATPAAQVMGNVSIVANLSSGQVGLQATGGPMTGLGGGAVVSPEVGIGLNSGPLQTGFSQSNTAYAQVSAVTSAGIPVDIGGSVNWSSGGGSVSAGFRGGVGTYTGVGGGQVVTGTLVTPPLWGKQD